MTAGLKSMVKKQKQMNDYQKKMAEIASKPALEQINLIKQMINQQMEETKKMQTKAIKLEKDIDKTNKKVEVARAAKAENDAAKGAQSGGGPNSTQTITSDQKQMKQITKLLAGTIIGTQSATDAKMGAGGQKLRE